MSDPIHPLADPTLRLPRDDGANVLHRQLRGETAASLGKVGREIDASLAALRACDAAPDADPADRAAALHACADAVWRYFVQREACGLMRHEPVIEAYGIPRAVLARVGAAPPSTQAGRARSR